MEVSARSSAQAFGVNLQRKLAEQHKSRETSDHVRLIISILVTFTAVVLGLLISNVKSSYDQFDSRLSAFAGDIIELDVRLREYGEDPAPIRPRALIRGLPRAPASSVSNSEIC